MFEYMRYSANECSAQEFGPPHNQVEPDFLDEVIFLSL